MKALVIYDSVFGNTRQIAQAVGSALGSPGNAEVLHVGNVTQDHLIGVDLLVVGSPTRGFRPTEAVTDFLKKLPSKALRGVRVAAFDTRIAVNDIESTALRFVVKTGGYAARPIAERLKKAGGDLIVPPEGFFVEGTEGPLKPGELERAGKWAEGNLATA